MDQEAFNTAGPTRAGYARDGCPADDVVHGCGGVHCEIGWIAAERAHAAAGVIDLGPYRKLVAIAAVDMLRRMLDEPRRLHTLDVQAEPERQLTRNREGKAAEVAYLIFRGFDPGRILADRRSDDDLEGVDVKLVRPRRYGVASMTLADGSWQRERRRPGFRWVGVSLSSDFGLARIEGAITVPEVAAGIASGAIPRNRARGRADGGDWYEIRVPLLHGRAE